MQGRAREGRGRDRGWGRWEIGGGGSGRGKERGGEEREMKEWQPW